MNKKAFTLVELIVSFVMISILSVVVFRTVVNVQRKQMRNIAYNSLVTFHSTINTVVQNDLTNKIIEEIEFCGRNCYKIKYLDEEIKELSIDSERRLIRYGGLLERLPESFHFYRDIVIQEDLFDAEVGNLNALVVIRIPLNSTILPNDRDLIYVYQYDSRVNPIRSRIS